MKKWWVSRLVVFLVCFSTIHVWAAAAPKVISMTAAWEKYIQPAEFEKISGVKVAKVVPRNAVQGASGQMNFIDKDNKVIFTATFETIDKATFKKNKASGLWKSIFNGPITGVGDEAYTGPKAGEQFILVFLKGTHWVTISGSLNIKTLKPELSMKQLKEIANIIIPRLK